MKTKIELINDSKILLDSYIEDIANSDLNLNALDILRIKINIIQEFIRFLDVTSDDELIKNVKYIDVVTTLLYQMHKLKDINKINIINSKIAILLEQITFEECYLND